MAGYGYQPRKYGATQTAVSNRQGLALTPLGISTRVAAKPAVKKDPVAGALTAVNNRQGLAGVNPTYNTPHAPARQPAPASAAGAPTPPALSYDYKADPILNQIMALSSQQRGDAQSNALMLRKQLAIDYGDPALGAKYGGDATAAAASGNPFGVRQQLKKKYDAGVQNLDQQYNDQNLWYGGARVKGLGDFTNDYQGQLAGVAGQQQAALGQIDSNLLAALLAADQQDISGSHDAQASALAAALAAGVDPGAGAPRAATNPYEQGVATTTPGDHPYSSAQLAAASAPRPPVAPDPRLQDPRILALLGLGRGR